ncbi:MAG: lipopolysaccharide biosynthesis protein [Bacteroidales bacterium]|nr:lipopolysaccharide biosynthesis protein [Bacteroidales bacterium]
MERLKNKTIKGVLWSSIDSFANQGLLFIFGIILARLLTPKEFGLIGMITVFITVSESIINSGFSQALIRKKDCSDADLSTVFYFNLAVGLLFLAILYISAPSISSFFKEPQLTGLVRVLCVVLIFDSLTIVQRATLTRQIDFKLQTRASIISTIFSGIVGITMAYSGFGVWSLVAKTIGKVGLNSLLLWLWNTWRPVLLFSVKSFKELFGFGSKLLLSGLIDTIYRNIYDLIIGKYYSAQELGFYTRANMFKNLPSNQLTSIISRVAYPALSQVQDDKLALKRGYKKIIKSTMYISFIVMAGMAAVAEPMVLTLVGENWLPSVIYLQLLCFVGAMYPLHAINLNMLNVQGRSDLFLKLEIIKKILAIPTIIIGIIWGIKVMILGMWFNTIVAYYLNSYYSGRQINYPMREQIADILPSLLLALIIGAIMALAGWLFPFSNLAKLILQIFLGILLVFGISEFFKLKDYLYLKDIVSKSVKSINNVKE